MYLREANSFSDWPHGRRHEKRARSKHLSETVWGHFILRRGEAVLLALFVEMIF